MLLISCIIYIYIYIYMYVYIHSCVVTFESMVKVMITVMIFGMDMTTGMSQGSG